MKQQSRHAYLMGEIPKVPYMYEFPINKSQKAFNKSDYSFYVINKDNHLINLITRRGTMEYFCELGGY